MFFQVSVEVRLPAKGEYGLEVFANDPEKEGDMFTHVCQYLCFYSDGRTEDLYGKVPGKVPKKRACIFEIKEITAADLDNVASPTLENGETSFFSIHRLPLFFSGLLVFCFCTISVTLIGIFRDVQQCKKLQMTNAK